jgi:hypothetical protein
MVNEWLNPTALGLHCDPIIGGGVPGPWLRASGQAMWGIGVMLGRAYDDEGEAALLLFKSPSLAGQGLPAADSGSQA